MESPSPPSIAGPRPALTQARVCGRKWACWGIYYLMDNLNFMAIQG